MTILLRYGRSRADRLIDAADALGLCALGGGGGGGYQTSSSTTNPPAFQLPYLQQAMSAAQNLFQNYTPQYYPGQTVAPFSPAQGAALQGVQSQAQAGEPITSAAMGFGTNLENGAYLDSNPGAALQMPFATGQLADPSQNPYFQSALSSTLSQVLPGITSQFVQGGNLSNPAAALAESQGAMSAASPFLFNAYQQGLGQQQQAAENIGNLYQQTLGTMTQGLASAPQVQQLPYNDLNALWGAGLAQQQQSQSGINADLAHWNYDQQLPYEKLAQFMGTIGGTGYGGTSTSTTPMLSNAFGNTAGNLLGGALGSGLLGLAFGI